MDIFRKAKTTIIMMMAASILLSGCSNKQQSAQKEQQQLDSVTKEKVSLTVRWSHLEEDMVKKMVQEFCEEYSDQAVFDITVVPASEEYTQNDILSDIQNAPDVFGFPDNQLVPMVAGGILTEIADSETVRSMVSEDSAKAVSIHDKMYAYPLTADNGYFLYYNKEYFTQEDVTSMDRILEVTKNSGKKFAMDLGSGWYLYSFFGSEGFELGLKEDGLANYCNWNTTENKIKGRDVIESIINIVNDPSYINLGDTGLIEKIESGEVIAAINGIWNADKISSVWGKGYAATKLPTYTCSGEQVQMSSFMGYRLVGVNSNSKKYEWASKLAQWLVNEQNQMTRYEEEGQLPCNSNIIDLIDPERYPTIAALSEQSKFAVLQSVSNNYWSATYLFGGKLLSGSLESNDLQKEIDILVEGITR